jgi:hypothetical protein
MPLPFKLDDYPDRRVVAGLRQSCHQFARRIPAIQLNRQAPHQQKLKHNPDRRIVAEAGLSDLHPKADIRKIQWQLSDEVQGYVLSANKRRSASTQFPPLNDGYLMPKRTFSNGKLPLPGWLRTACRLAIAGSAAFAVSSSCTRKGRPVINGLICRRFRNPSASVSAIPRWRRPLKMCELCCKKPGRPMSRARPSARCRPI